MTLDADDVEAIARRVAELVGQVPGLVDAHSVAAELQVERDWVYAHARERSWTSTRRLRLRLDPRGQLVDALAHVPQVEAQPLRPLQRLQGGLDRGAGGAGAELHDGEGQPR